MKDAKLNKNESGGSALNLSRKMSIKAELSPEEQEKKDKADEQDAEIDA